MEKEYFISVMRDYLKSLNVAIDKIENGSEAEAGYIAEKMCKMVVRYTDFYKYTPFPIDISKLRKQLGW